MSFGDPDGSIESKNERQWQEKIRFIDDLIYPDEKDIPGLTFPSVVEWAPWMETIWFGNLYEYKTAYFQDVMYSNQRPYREGALLFEEKNLALIMAMLYQRYKKFDQSSYSLPNATFYNIFGKESLRIGRYKIPQSSELIYV